MFKERERKVCAVKSGFTKAHRKVLTVGKYYSLPKTCSPFLNSSCFSQTHNPNMLALN